MLGRPAGEGLFATDDNAPHCPQREMCGENLFCALTQLFKTPISITLKIFIKNNK